MTPLITPTEALRRAFRSHERLPIDSLTEADLVTAEERYLKPTLGSELLAAIRAGNYPTLLADHLATPLALFARVIALPRLALHTSPIGHLAPKTDCGTAADDGSLRRLRNALRREAETLLRRTSRHLDEAAADYPEYIPEANLFNRCSTYGGFVQIR